MPMKTPLLPLSTRVALFLVWCLALRLDAEPSKIYGANGEAWLAAGGPLPDFSYAGYQRGEKPLPERTPDVSV